MRHATSTSSNSYASGSNASGRAVAIALAESSDARAQSQRVKRIWILCAAVVICWLLSNVASAQQYATINLPAEQVTPERIAERERAAKTLATTRKLEQMSAGERKNAEIYMQHIVPYLMVRKENLNQIGPMLSSLEKSLNTAQRINNPGKGEFLKHLYVGMSKVAKGNYIPAARINAILVLGRLDYTPYDGTTGRPPVPLAARVGPAFDQLVALYENEQEVDGVRAAALQSLHRTTMYGFPYMQDASKAKLSTLMTQLLESPAPEGRDPKAHAYLQRSAVDILHYLSTPQDTDLGKQLISISTDEEKPDLIALYSAEQIGQMTSQLDGQVADVDGVLKSWTRRAFDTVESELQRLKALDRTRKTAVKQPPSPESFLGLKESKKKKDKARSSAMRGGMGMGMEDMMMSGMDMDMGMEDSMMSGMEMDMGMEDMMMSGMGMMGRMPAAKPQPPEVSLSRRRITKVLQQVLRGAAGTPLAEVPEDPSGLLAGVSDENKKIVQDWINDIKPVADAINDDQLDDQKKWIESLEEQRIVLADLAGVELEDADNDLGDDGMGPLNGGLPGFGLPGAGLPGAGLPDAGSPEAEDGLPGAAPAAGLPGVN
ncbi:hypothetical protein LOC71_14025 [Rhodopirellula sp. JC740]|uniref:Secreted protein n=1 Tax=Rhodopirellula halodulae TaxID=2894198 RepID=A0ABS8NIK6_9BACT|nr:hypothetical protein [Rhodopirellula sp. JC740]MCC9643398.1 hypothetical protein [Rhodopirellula sp. JC740]